MRIGYSSSGSGEKPPAGFHVAVLAGVYDIGRQKKEFAGESKIQHQVVMVWEIDKRDTKGRRFTLADYVTASTHEKSGMYKRIAALVGRTPKDEDFDTSMVVGRSVYMMLKEPAKDGGWPRIDTMVPLPPGMTSLLPEFKEDPIPKYVTTAREKAVGGWKAPTPTPPNKSAPAPAQGGALPSREAPDTIPNPDGSSPNSDMPF